jgi:hypothetical protein
MDTGVSEECQVNFKVLQYMCSKHPKIISKFSISPSRVFNGDQCCWDSIFTSWTVYELKFNLMGCSAVQSRWSWSTLQRCICLHHHHSDNGGSMLLWNVGQLERDYMTLHPRRLQTSYSPPWEPEISRVLINFVNVSLKNPKNITWVGMWRVGLCWPELEIHKSGRKCSLRTPSTTFTWRC